MQRMNISQTQPIPLPQPKGAPRSEHVKYLDTQLDEILEMIISGKSFRKIALFYNIPMMSLFYWRQNSVHSDEITQCLQWTSEQDAQNAEDVLIDFIESGSKNIAEAAITKELSQFYRWRASKRAPKVFGNNTDVNVKVEVSTLSATKFKGLLDGLKAKKLAEEGQSENDMDINNDSIDGKTHEDGSEYIKYDDITE